MPQQAVVQPAQISVKSATVVNNGKWLAVGVPLVGSGLNKITSVLILSATLDSVTPTEPALPWWVGDLKTGQGAPLTFFFPLNTMTPGEQHTIAVFPFGRH